MGHVPENIGDILPVQIGRRELSPEKRLYAAVIANAIEALRGVNLCNESAGALGLEAREWIAGAHARITFEQACEVLGLDVDRARRAMLRIVEAGGSRQAAA